MIFSDESLDETLAAKEKLSKEKQQVWNRGRSELLSSDHKQTRADIRANLEPGYYIPYSGKKKIKVLQGVVTEQCLSNVSAFIYGTCSSLPWSRSFSTPHLDSDVRVVRREQVLKRKQVRCVILFTEANLLIGVPPTPTRVNKHTDVVAV